MIGLLGPSVAGLRLTMQNNNTSKPVPFFARFIKTVKVKTAVRAGTWQGTWRFGA